MKSGERGETKGRREEKVEKMMSEKYFDTVLEPYKPEKGLFQKIFDKKWKRIFRVMANFKKALEKVLKWEGGKVDDPLDKGGRTYKGVTQRTYNQYFVGDVFLMTEYQCEYIYKDGYWCKIKGDLIESQSIAELLMDFAVNSGVSRASKAIQQLVGVSVDGIIGKQTIAAINKADKRQLFDKLKNYREKYYKSLNQPRFLRGWLNRLNSYTFAE